MKFNYVCLPFHELSAAQLYEILHLRSDIFVVEQNCIYQDVDRKDIQTGVYHLMMLSEGKLVGYARLLPAELSYPTPSIGRVLVSSTLRNEGLGREIMQEAINRTQFLWPNHAITIGAQSHLSNFYQSFGFREISKPYLEDDILHVDMQLDTP